MFFSDLVRYQCYVQKVPENVIDSMKKFAEDETLQETCLEALAVLVAAGIMISIDLKYIVLLKFINTHPDGARVGRKTLT